MPAIQANALTTRLCLTGRRAGVQQPAFTLFPPPPSRSIRYPQNRVIACITQHQRRTHCTRRPQLRPRLWGWAARVERLCRKEFCPVGSGGGKWQKGFSRFQLPEGYRGSRQLRIFGHHHLAQPADHHFNRNSGQWMAWEIMLSTAHDWVNHT